MLSKFTSKYIIALFFKEIYLNANRYSIVLTHSDLLTYTKNEFDEFQHFWVILTKDHTKTDATEESFFFNIRNVEICPERWPKL